MEATEATYEYEPSSRFGFYKRSSDGEEFHVQSKEVREARSRGVVAPGKSKRVPSPKTERAAGDAPPRRVRPPRTISHEEKKPVTRKAQALEFGVLAGLVFQGVAMIRGNHWLLHGDQQALWGDAIAGVAPTLPEKVVSQIKIIGPWAKLAMVAQETIVPRIAQDMVLMAQVRDEARRKQQPPAPGAAPAYGPIPTENGKAEHVHTVVPDIPGVSAV